MFTTRSARPVCSSPAGGCLAISASGDIDSTVLAYIMKTLDYRCEESSWMNWVSDNFNSFQIVSQVELKNNCTFCWVVRRQALDRGAMQLGVNKIVTGHNADDIAETVIMNILRGDIARLQRCTSITTSSGSEDSEVIPRCKPLKYTYEKEIVMYAYFKKLDYFSTECIYSPNAYRGHARF